MALVDVGVIVTAVEHIWAVSVAAVPAIFLAFFIIYLTQRDVPSFPSLAISSQRDMALHHSTYVLTGVVTGGLLNMMLPGIGVMLGAAVAMGPVFYGLVRKDLPPPTTLELSTISEAVHLVWIAVPLLAVTAIAANQIFLQSVVALVFYTTIFWEL